MSISQTAPLRAVATVAVAPTETTIASLTRDELKGAKRVTVYIYNADATQTFAGLVYRKMTNGTAYAPSTLPDFGSIGPLTAAMADLDVEGTDLVEIRGTQSGAGGNVQIGVNRKVATP